MSLTISGYSDNTIILKKGEIKQFTFTLNVDISSAEFFFGVKESKDDTSYKISKNHSDFTINVSNKTASVIIDTSSLDANKKYYAELKTSWGSTSVDKTEDFYIYIDKAVTS